jgi:hypothetical protein
VTTRRRCRRWLGDHRVEPVVVDDTKAKAVQQSLQTFK